MLGVFYLYNRIEFLVLSLVEKSSVKWMIPISPVTYKTFPISLENVYLKYNF